MGGTSVSFHDTGDVTTEQLRDAFADAGEGDAVIQTTSADGAEGFLVRTTTTSAEDATAIANQVAGSFGWSTDSFEVTTIGPDWGTSVIKASVLAFLVSLVLIIIYISLRFRDYKMGVTAVVALLHDLILVFGIYALLGREVTPNTIAAILTILGYSLYDTVVVFHRINENMKDESIKCTFMSMANHSINEVLMRSMNTSITSLIPVVAMLLFGGETLKDFALAMTIGLVAGAYSSYAIATPLYAVWKTTEERFARLRKKHGDEVQRFVLNRLPEEAAKIAAAVNAADRRRACVRRCRDRGGRNGRIRRALEARRVEEGLVRQDVFLQGCLAHLESSLPQERQVILWQRHAKGALRTSRRPSRRARSSRSRTSMAIRWISNSWACSSTKGAATGSSSLWTRAIPPSRLARS